MQAMWTQPPNAVLIAVLCETLNVCGCDVGVMCLNVGVMCFNMWVCVCMHLDLAVLFNRHFFFRMSCCTWVEFHVAEAFVYIALSVLMCQHTHRLHVCPGRAHACVCRWDFCPPSQLPTETNQAESCQAAGLVGTESLAELLTLRICSFKVPLTSQNPYFSPEMYYIMYYSQWLGLKWFYPLQSLVLAVKKVRTVGEF